MSKKIFIISLLTLAFSILGLNLTDKANISAFANKSNNKKVLIVYFSHSGNTRIASEKAKALTGADIVELKMVEKYSDDYATVLKKAREELESNARPKLATKIKNISDYDTIILAYPNWCGTVPMPIYTFLDQYDLKGKTIAPLCTHGSGGIGNSVKDITKHVPNAKVTEGLGIKGKDVKKSDADLRAWLKKISII